MTSSAKHVPAANSTTRDPSTFTTPTAAPRDSFAISADVLLRVVLLLLAASAVVLWCITIITDLASHQGKYDFSFYYDAALAYRANIHANIYDQHVLQAVAKAHHVFLGTGVYQYPPLLPILVLPLTFLSFQAAVDIWLFMNLVLWLAGTILLVGLLRRALFGAEPPALRMQELDGPALRSRGGFAARLVATWNGLSPADVFAIGLATIISLTYAPLAQTIQLGQASMSIFFLIMLSFWLLRRGHLGWAGAVLGLATMIKLLPIVLIGYFLLRLQWRVVGGAIAAMVVLLTGMTVVLGPQGVLAMRAIVANGASDSMRFQNEALARMPMWIGVALGGHPSSFLLDVGYVLIGLVAIAFVAGVVVVSRRARTAPALMPWLAPQDRRVRWSVPTLDLLGYGWALCTMVLVSPIFWKHHASWLLPALIICLGCALRQLSRDPSALPGGIMTYRIALVVVALVIGGYALTMVDLPYAFDSTSTIALGPSLLHQPLRPYFMLMRPLGTLLLWTASGMSFLRLSRYYGKSSPSATTVESTES